MGIRQLASELRLSIGTVSRALNDRPDVNPETRARVKAAALRAGYVPNQSGRSLRSGRTGIVAAVIPAYGVAPQSDAGLFTVLEGARRTLQRRALDLIVLFRGSEEEPLLNLQRIVQRRIADSIIVSQTTPNDPRIAWMKAEGVEFVAFGRCRRARRLSVGRLRLRGGRGRGGAHLRPRRPPPARRHRRRAHRELRVAAVAGAARRGVAARHRRRGGDGAADRGVAADRGGLRRARPRGRGADRGAGLARDAGDGALRRVRRASAGGSARTSR